MKLSRIAALGSGIAALLLGAAALAPGALAQAPPTPVTGSTTGNAGPGVAGNATVFNLADLKTTGKAGPLICTPAVNPTSCNYDDDPAPNADNHFVVVPNLDDAPLQWANKYVFINNPAGVLQVQKTISAVHPPAGATTPPGPNTFTVVFDDLQPGTNIKTGLACTDLLGLDGTVGSVANGLITTGQKTAAELLSVRNGCQQGTIGILVNPFPISKHLPPGIYRQCAVLAQTGGAVSPTFCEYFKILPITGFQTDVNVVNYGNLVQNTKSIFGGNFVMPLDAPSPTPGTIQGIGNTSPKLLVAYTCMYNDYNKTPTQTADDKLICSKFDVQINRQDVLGAIIATQRVDNILGGGHPLISSPSPFGPDADLSTGPATGVAPFQPICLEPNENLKLDFSVTPQEVLYPGIYSGLVRLTVTNSNVPANCTPTLGNGESALGDANSVYNNLPGIPVSQVYP